VAKRAAWIGVLTVIVSAGAHTAPLQKGPAETGPGSTAAARRFLEGRWSLQSFEVRPPGKPPIHLRGSGTLTYDGFGNLQIEIRVDEETAALLEAAGVRTSRGVLSTTGRAIVDMQARTLTYVLDGQVPFNAPPFRRPSGPLALERPRHWQIDGNVLTLTTRGDDGQPVSIGRWEKLQ
jgi:hypothetical protein